MRSLLLLAFAFIVGFLAFPLACSSPARYADGAWEGKTPRSAEGYEGRARIVVEGGKIVDASCSVFDSFTGKAVDAGYAEVLGEGIGEELAGLKAYAEGLVRSQDPASVKELREASWSYPFFEASMDAAIGKARRALEPLGLADGDYAAAEPSADAEGYLTTCELSVRSGRIASCEVVIRDVARGRPFDASYEEVFAGSDEYVAQSRADWAGLQSYESALVELQRPESVDAVSGATWSYGKFRAVVGMALEEAAGKK